MAFKTTELIISIWRIEFVMFLLEKIDGIDARCERLKTWIYLPFLWLKSNVFVALKGMYVAQSNVLPHQWAGLSALQSNWNWLANVRCLALSWEIVFFSVNSKIQRNHQLMINKWPLLVDQQTAMIATQLTFIAKKRRWSSNGSNGELLTIVPRVVCIYSHFPLHVFTNKISTIILRRERELTARWNWSVNESITNLEMFCRHCVWRDNRVWPHVIAVGQWFHRDNRKDQTLCARLRKWVFGFKRK